MVVGSEVDGGGWHSHHQGGGEAAPQGPGALVLHNLHKGVHGASEAGGVLKPGGVAGAIWAQIQRLQHSIAVQEAFPCGSERGGQFCVREAPEFGRRSQVGGVSSLGTEGR